GRIGIRAPDRLVQSGYLIVERFAALIEATQGPRGRLRDRSLRQFRIAAAKVRSDFEQVEQASGIAIGSPYQQLPAFCSQAQLPCSQATLLISQRLIDHSTQRLIGKRGQNMSPHAREQRIVELEGWV